MVPRLKDDVEALIEKLQYTREAGGIVITTATAIKSLILKFVEVQRILCTADPELLHNLSWHGFRGADQNSKRLKKNATELHAAVAASDGLAKG